MWNMKCKIIRVTTEATEIVIRGVKQTYEAMPEKQSVDSLQDSST
jgi:hypothetical protein